jgi:hypothetical protein
MRYFFNIRDQRGLIPDEEGSELSGIVAARCEANASARDFAVDDLRSGNPVHARCIEITDEQGTVLETLAVRDVVSAGCN